MKKNYTKFVWGLFGLLFLVTPFNVKADDGPTLASTINTYGAGGGTGGALNAVWNAGTSTVTVTNTSGTPITGATQTLTLNIDEGVIVLWTASLTGSTNPNSSTIIAITGGGAFEMTGGLVSQTGEGRAINFGGTGALNIFGGTVKSNTGVAVWHVQWGLTTVTEVDKVNHPLLITSAAQDGSIMVANNGTENTVRLVITSGTITNTQDGMFPSAVNNNSNGIVNITGGTISTLRGAAVRSNRDGLVHISEADKINNPTLIFANEASMWGGALFIEGGSQANVRAIITGGTLEERFTGNNNGYAIRNQSIGNIEISGGTIRGLGGGAIYNGQRGCIIISETDKINQPTIITSVGNDVFRGTIRLNNSGFETEPRLVMTGGLVENTAVNNANDANAIGNASWGAVNISGGTVKAAAGCAILNDRQGVVTISEPDKNNPTLITCASTHGDRGAILLETTGSETAPRLIITGGTIVNAANNTNARAIRSFSYGAINIFGGTIKATLGSAIVTNSRSTMTISETDPINQPLRITSANEEGHRGTIFLDWGFGTEAETPLTLLGGIVENTSSNANGRTIQNFSAGNININGGLVYNTFGTGIVTTDANSVVTVGGTGTVFAYGNQLSDVISNSSFTAPVEDGVVLAWNQSAGNTEYIFGSDEDIFSLPVDIAEWYLINDASGIYYTKGANERFIEIAGVTVDAAGVPPTILTATLPNGVVGMPYNATLIVTGDTPIAWSVESGTFPNGLTLSPGGVISGTPTQENTFTFTLKAENSAGSDTKALAIDVLFKVPPTITTTTLPNGLAGTEYNATLTATGDAPIVWSLVASSLPNGLSLSENGVISGTPTEGGVFTLNIEAENEGGSVTKELNLIVIDCAIGVTTFPLQEGFENNGPNIPVCWSQIHESGYPDFWTIQAHVNPVLPNGGTFRARYWGNTGITKLVTPKLDLSSIEFPRLKFWHLMPEFFYQQLNQDELHIYYKNSSGGNWILLESYTTNVEFFWIEREILLPNKSNDYYIAFEAHGHFGGGVYLDNITVENFELYGAPASVSNLAISSSGTNTANISWTNPTLNQGGESLTQLTSVKIYVNNGTTPIYTNNAPVIGGNDSFTHTITTQGVVNTYTVIAENTIGGGQVNKFYVHNFPWTEGFNEPTVPAYWTQDIVHGRDVWQIEMGHVRYWGDGGIAKLITPQLNVGSLENPALKFKFQQQFSGSGQNEMYVYYKNSINGTWNVLSYYGNVENWTEMVIPLPEKSDDYYIAFEAHGHFGWSTRLDDITIENSTLTFDPPVITTESLPAGIVGEVYSTALTATGFTPITWSMASGSLPSGLSLNATTGVISGMATTVNTYNFTVKATNAIGNDTKALSITVGYNHPPVTDPITATDMGATAKINWGTPVTPSVTFRFDSGTANGQLGFNDPYPNGVMGSCHRVDAELTKIQWFLTDNAQPVAEHVNIFIFALNESGMPTNTVIYSKTMVPTTNMAWNEFEFPNPVSAPNGFFMALSRPVGNFLSLGTSNPTSGWPFQPQTHFYSSDYTQYGYTAVDGNFTINFMLRAVGTINGKTSQFGYTVEMGTANPGEQPVFTKSTPFVTEEPAGESSKNVLSYTVFRLIQGQPETNWTMLTSSESELTYTDNNWNTLPPGNYQWAIKANYTTGQSEAKLTNALNRLSINENDLTNPVLYPNPFTNEIYVNNPETVKTVQIFSAMGQKIEHVTFNGKSIKTDNLSSGVYFVTIETLVGDKLTHKMIKK